MAGKYGAWTLVAVKRLFDQPLEAVLNSFFGDSSDFPKPTHEFQEARHRLKWVAIGDDEFRVGKELDERLDATREGRVLTEVNLFGSIEVELTPETLSVEAHHAAAFSRRPLVDVVKIHDREIWDAEGPGTRRAGVCEDAVIFFWVVRGLVVRVLGF